MSDDNTVPFRFDPDVLRENRGKFPLDELRKYGDQWVAWSADGTTIVAHHDDLIQVGKMLDEKGIPSETVVLEWIPPEGEVNLL